MARLLTMVVRNPFRERSASLNLDGFNLRQRQFQNGSQKLSVCIISSEMRVSVYADIEATVTQLRCLDYSKAIKSTFIVKSIAIRTITLTGIAEATVGHKGQTLGKLH